MANAPNRFQPNPPVGMFVVISERRHGLRILPLTVRSEWKTRRGKHLAIGPIPGGPHAAFEAQTCKTMMGQKALCFEVVQVRHFESPKIGRASCRERVEIGVRGGDWKEGIGRRC